MRQKVTIDTTWSTAPRVLLSRWSLACATMALTLAVAAGIVASPSAHAQSQPKTDFSWSPDAGEYVSHDKVVFANGAEIRSFRSDQKPILGCDMSGVAYKLASSQTFYTTDICDSVAHINAAWPSVTNAKVAIVSTNCGGSICHSYSDYFVVLIDGSSIKVLQVGTGHAGPRGKLTKFSFAFNGNEVKSSTITNLYSGTENNLGDLVGSKRTLLKGKGYAADAFKPQYIELVGEHPERFMENETLRAALVAKTGPANFRSLRTSLSGPGSSKLLDGRFVLMQACQKSFCDSSWGAVVIDGFTGDAISLELEKDSTKVVHFSTRPLNEELDSSWIYQIDTGGSGYISMDKGVISVRR